MKKSFLFVLGAACLLSFGVISFSPKYQETRADDVVNAGIVTVSFKSAISSGFYLSCDDAGKDIPYDEATGDWDYCVFKTTDSTAIIKNDAALSINYIKTAKLKKIAQNDFFLDVTSIISSKKSGDKLLFQGNWSATVGTTTYQLTLAPFTMIWNGVKWAEEPKEFVIPDLETYDTITLVDAGYDDFDHFLVNCNSDPSVWNTFAFSEENTSRSFTFEFVFEASTDMVDDEEKQKPLEIRLGTVADTSWDKGHFYKFNLCNVWGFQNKGSVIFERHDHDDEVDEEYSSSEINVDLTRDSSHIIEFGSIYLKDSKTDAFEFIKFDGEYVYQGHTPFRSGELLARNRA